MRIKSAQDLALLGSSAQKQISPYFRNGKNGKSPVTAQKNKAKDSGSSYCEWPSKDPAHWLHAALEKRYGMFFNGGELACELIIPGGDQRWRFDWAWPRYRVALEQDGFGYHRDLNSFKRDRRKQMHALVNGWVVIRTTNEDIRKRFEQLVDEIEQVLSHRSFKPANIKPIGKTQCEMAT